MRYDPSWPDCDRRALAVATRLRITPPSARLSQAHHLLRYRGSGRCSRVWYVRGEVALLAGSWSYGKSTSPSYVAASGSHILPRPVRSMRPIIRQFENTGASKDVAISIRGSERDTAQASSALVRFTRLFGKLELNRPLRLLLHNDRARSHTPTLCYIVNAKTDQIATA